MALVLFLKAKLPGAAMGDLFSGPTQVSGYAARSGAYVAPYQATRRKRAAPGPEALALFAHTRAVTVKVDPELERQMPGTTDIATALLRGAAPGCTMEVAVGTDADMGRSNGLAEWPKGTHFKLYVRPGRPREAMMRTLLHEIGHLVTWTSLAAAPVATREAVIKQWAKDKNRSAKAVTVLRWLSETGLEPHHPLMEENVMRVLAPESQNAGWLEYGRDFNEWVADTAAAWMTTDKRPQGAIETFMAGVAKRLVKLLRQAAELIIERNPKPGALQAHLGQTWDRREPIEVGLDQWWWQNGATSRVVN